MNSLSDLILVYLGIAPWPEADDYKEKNKPMTQTNEFSYFDEYPHEDPFVNAYDDDDEDDSDTLYGADYDDFTEDVESDLRLNIQQFLSFSTKEALLKIVDEECNG